MSTDVERRKESTREALLTARRARAQADRAEASQAVALHAGAVPALATARRVAAYLSLPSEPGTGPLLRWLLERGVDVIVPVSLPDRTLDWARLNGDDLSAGARTGDLGVPEPTGPRLGPAALAACDVVLVPALAVDHAGNRLGRGAGYYDRALADHRGLVCAIVFADELVPALPHEPHDRPVDLVLTPAGVFRPEREWLPRDRGKPAPP